MADVNVTVQIDGKPAYVAGAVGTPDAYAFTVAALQQALDHFRAVKGASTPQTVGLMGFQGGQSLQGAQSAKDTSL